VPDLQKITEHGRPVFGKGKPDKTTIREKGCKVVDMWGGEKGKDKIRSETVLNEKA